MAIPVNIRLILESRRSSQGGGRVCVPPYTLPLDPPLFSYNIFNGSPGGQLCSYTHELHSSSFSNVPKAMSLKYL